MSFDCTIHRIIFPTADGVAVSVVSPQCELSFEEIIAQTIPANTPYRLIVTADLPADRHFRGAWTFVESMDDDPIGIDIDKARAIHRAKIRIARSPLLARLDVQFMQALETGASTTEIAATKQALRDAPGDPGIAAAQDLIALKTQWNSDLLGASPYLS